MVKLTSLLYLLSFRKAFLAMIELVGVWMGHQASDGAPCNNYVLFTKHPHAYLLLPEKKQMKRTVSISQKRKRKKEKKTRV